MLNLYKDSVWLPKQHRAIWTQVYKTDDGKTVIHMNGEMVEVETDHTGFYSAKDASCFIS